MTGPNDTDRGRVDAPLTDTVTGALTRAALAACLDGAMAHARLSEGSCSVFVFDVDHFKSVNDVYGHARGDLVLRQVTDRVNQVIRGSDVLIRYGGDEFVVVLPGTDRAGAMDAAIRLVEGVGSTPFAGDPPLTVSVSLGLATYPDDATGADELIGVADRRNYLAKRRGRAVAVGDDLAADGSRASGRLLEREAALAAAQDFLIHLDDHTRGTLRVIGEAGIGHTRFIAEVARLARLRGYTVWGLRNDQAPECPERPERILVIADTGDDPKALVERACASDAGAVPVGLLHAVHEATGEDPPLPLLGEITLSALSASALKVWLRTTLQGEPSPALTQWIIKRSRGVVGRAEHELDQLAARGGLESGAGGPTVSAALLARANRARRPARALSTLVGREREVRDLTKLLAERRLVTLVGAGGIGKTRLALEVAHAVADDFVDGAVLVPLAEATTTDLVVSTVAQALDIAENPAEPLATTVVRYLAQHEMLLVLDNFEQVLVASRFVAELLSGAPQIKVVATSRERLRLSGEQVYPVQPLALPDLDHLPARTQDLSAALATSPALALFVVRAREAAYDLRLTPSDVAAAAAVCHRLDGLPLAIELAAARCDMLTPAELHGQLSERLDLLAEGPQDQPLRQQTLRATIEWSFALLDAEHRDLLAQLGVFVGGCSTEAVAAVCRSAVPAPAVIDERLSALIDKNLLGSAPTPDGIRFTMLETIRSYAVERLEAAANAEAVHASHAAYFAAFAERAGRELNGPAQADWHDRISRDYLNLRAAFEWATGHGDGLTAARIALGLGDHWRGGKHITEGRSWYGRTLSGDTSLPPDLRSRMLERAAFLAAIQCDARAALELGEECLRLARQLSDGHLVNRALNVVGLATEMAGDLEAARAHHVEGLALALRRDDKMAVVKHRGNLSLLALHTGDLETAYGYALRNLEGERELGNLRGVALTLDCLGQVHLGRGDAEGAGPLLAESLRISRQLGDTFCEARALHHVGLVARLSGDQTAARQQIAAALRLYHEVGDQKATVAALVDLADLLEAATPTVAATLLAAVEPVRERCHLTASDADATHRLWLDAVARVRTRLTGTDLAAAWTAGQTTPLGQLVEEMAASAGD